MKLIDPAMRNLLFASEASGSFLIAKLVKNEVIIVSEITRVIQAYTV
jgi:hypothetical protein